MKHALLAAILFIVMVSSVQGGAFPPYPMMQHDRGEIAIQNIAPSYRKDITLTGNSQTIDVSADLNWKAYTTGAAVFRTMSSTARHGIQHTIPAATWTGETVNHSITSKTFLNISGSAGTMRRQ